MSSPLWLLIRVVKRALYFLSPFISIAQQNQQTSSTRPLGNIAKKHFIHSAVVIIFFAFCLLDFYVLSILVLMVGKKAHETGFFRSCSSRVREESSCRKRNMLKVSIAVAFDCCDISLTNSQRRVNILQLMSTHSSCCCPILAITIG